MEKTQIVTQRVTLHLNGDPIHFDVTVDFQKVAMAIGHKASNNYGRTATIAGGGIKVVASERVRL